jgi:hypothetical protein
MHSEICENAAKNTVSTVSERCGGCRSCYYWASVNREQAGMNSEAMLLWGLLFGSAGMGFFMYGRRQEKIIAKYCGLALMVYPYFAPNTLSLVGIGVALSALPFLLRA